MSEIRLKLEILGLTLFWIEAGTDGHVQIALLVWRDSGVFYFDRNADDDEDWPSRIWCDIMYYRAIRRALYWRSERKRRAKIQAPEPPHHPGCYCTTIKDKPR